MTTTWKGGRRLGKAVWGKKLLGGYAGVKNTAVQITNLYPDISKYKLYVEPFSGLGRTAQYVNNISMVLNDKSEFANYYCKKKFPNADVSNMDFMETINKYDSEDTFFLIDPPWRFDTYDVNTKSFCDRDVITYYTQILKRIDTLKADWFLLSSADEHEQKNILRDSKWGIKIVVSDNRVIFGKYARTMICSNLFDPTIKEDYEDRFNKPVQMPVKVREVQDDICKICFAKFDNYEEHINRPFHKEYL